MLVRERIVKLLSSPRIIPIGWSIACVISGLICLIAGAPKTDVAIWSILAASPGLFGYLMARTETALALHLEIATWLLSAACIMAASGGIASPAVMILALAVARPAISDRPHLVVPVALLAVMVALLSHIAAGSLFQSKTAAIISPMLSLNALALMALYGLQFARQHDRNNLQDNKAIATLELLKEQKQKAIERARNIQNIARQFRDERDNALKQITDMQQAMTEGETRALKAEQNLAGHLHIFASVGKQLHNHANSIIGLANELRKSDPASPPVQYGECARHIHENSQYLAIQIENIGNLCHLTDNSYRLHPGPVSLKDAAQHAVTTIASYAGSRRINISMLRGQTDVEAYADPDALRQIISNMIVSALDRTLENGRIAIWMRQLADGYAVLGLQDSGSSMSTDDILRTSRIDLRNDGFGLVVAKYLIELHGGNLNADSKPYHGNTVWVSFPPAPGISEEYMTASPQQELVPVP